MNINKGACQELNHNKTVLRFYKKRHWPYKCVYQSKELFPNAVSALIHPEYLGFFWCNFPTLSILAKTRIDAFMAFKTDVKCQSNRIPRVDPTFGKPCKIFNYFYFNLISQQHLLKCTTSIHAPNCLLIINNISRKYYFVRVKITGTYHLNCIETNVPLIAIIKKYGWCLRVGLNKQIWMDRDFL